MTLNSSASIEHLRLGEMFAPNVVAVIGASPDSHHTRNLLNGLRRQGYQGRVYPINPSRSAILGFRAYESIAKLPEKPDFAVILLPAHLIPKVLREIAASGCRTAYILASGFEDQEELANLRELAQSLDILLLGPNCNGYVNANAGIHMWVGPLLRPYKSGALALVGHSSGVIASTMNSVWERGLGVSWMLAVGNEANFTLSDALRWVATDLDTKVIVCYVEAFGDYAHFFDAVRECRSRNIVVIVVAVGLSETGRRVALSHTGSVTAQPAIAKAAIEAVGALQASSMDEALDYASLFAQLPRQAWRAVESVGIFSVSGGFSALAADIFSAQGIKFPELPAEIRTLLPDVVAPNNPMDLTGKIYAFADRYATIADAFVESDEFDAVIALLGAWDGYFERWFAPVMAWAYRAKKPVIVAGLEETGIGDGIRKLSEAQPMPIIQGIERTARSLTAMQRYHAWRPYLERENAGNDSTRWDGQTIATLLGMEKTLREHGLEVANHVMLAHSGSSSKSFPDFSQRLVVKLESCDLLHKTEHGAVKIIFGNEVAVGVAVDELRNIAEKLELKQWSIIAQPFIEPALELLVGVIFDHKFGPVMTVGLGGIFVELLDRRVHMLCPFSEEKAEAIVKELNLAPLLDGYRGRPHLNGVSLCKALAAISRLAWQYRDDLIELDLNPLMVGETTTVVVDALASFRKSASSNATRLNSNE